MFAPSARGERRLIIATNIAETSLTLCGVRVVIDPGTVKEKRYEPGRGLEDRVVVSLCSRCYRRTAVHVAGTLGGADLAVIGQAARGPSGAHV